MPTIQVSRYLRLNLEARFGAIFNDALAAACEEFQIADLAYNINFDQAAGAPQNFFRDNRTPDELMVTAEPDFSALSMWTGEGQNQQLQKPRVFSGPVMAHWRFLLAVRGLRKVGLVDLREATEAAMLVTMDPELPGLGYRGDLGWQSIQEQQWIDQDQNNMIGFLQVVDYFASFEVNI